MSTNSTSTDTAESDAQRDAELAVLREENSRLREEYRRARQHKHQQTARGLAAIGVLALLAGALFAGVRDVLIVIGSIGLFGALLTYYLTPERVTTASVVESIHDTHTRTITSLTEELGLQDTHIYAPTDDPTESSRLFIPQHTNHTLPDTLSTLFITTSDDTRGISLPPIGGGLLDTLEPAQPTIETADDALALATDSLVEQFELATTATYDLDPGRTTITITDEHPADLTTPDHPAVSLCAVTLATTLETPVTVSETTTDHVTLTWHTQETETEQ